MCGTHYARWRAGDRGERLTRPIKGTAPPTCPVEGCDNLRFDRTYCNTHRKRIYKNGEPGPAGRIAPPRRNPSSWGIGKYKTAQGYVMLDRNVKGGRKRILEHRAVMEGILGRSLHQWENVHHKNGIRHDNRAENLELWVKAQPVGARIEDLVAFVVDNYPEAVDALRSRRAQLRLVRDQEVA